MSDAQKFITRNRAPRVQIEYDVELYGASKRVELPFVMGVMSDLSGGAEKPAVKDRDFLEIDVDNFDDRMRAIAPTARFSVPNTLTGEGQLSVDLTFTKMADFDPASVAMKNEALRPLLEARKQLTNLMAYMDGKSGAEALIEKLLKQPELLSALVSSNNSAKPDVDGTLAELSAKAEDALDLEDTTDATLSALADKAPADSPEDTGAADVLSNLSSQSIEETVVDDQARALESLAGADVPDELEDTRIEDVLSNIEHREAETDPDRTDDILDNLEVADGAPSADADDIDAALASVAETELVSEDAESEVDSILGGIETVDPTSEDLDDLDTVLSGIETVSNDTSTDLAAEDILGELTATPVPDVEEEPDVADLLSSLEVEASDDHKEENVSAILAGIEPVETAVEEIDDVAASLANLKSTVDASGTEPVTNDHEDVLARLDTGQSVEDTTKNAVEDVLSTVEKSSPDESNETDLDDILSGIETQSDESASGQDNLDDILSGLDQPDPVFDDAKDETADALASIDTVEPEPNVQDDLDDILAGVETASSENASEAIELDNILGQIDTATPADDSEQTQLDDVLTSIDRTEPEATTEDDLDGILAGLEAQPEESDPGTDNLDDILSGLDQRDPVFDDALDEQADALASVDTVEPESKVEDDLDDILGGIETGSEAATEPQDDLDNILSGLEVGGSSDEKSPGPEDQAPDDQSTADEADLDDILSGVEPATEDGSHPGTGSEGESTDPLDDLDALLGDLETEPGASDNENTESGDLDGLLGDLVGSDDANADNVSVEDDLDLSTQDKGEQSEDLTATQSPFGKVGVPRPVPSSLHRPTFRLALFGDFTGRAANGKVEIGDALASRPPIELDVDTIDDVIEGFSTRLTLPIGADGAGVEMKLSELDDLHPDELYDNLSLFDQIAGLRQQLSVGSIAERTTETLKSWAETFNLPIRLPKTSAGTVVPADLKLTDFQKLIGDTRGALSSNDPVDALIAQIVGPHIVKAPDAGANEMAASVDEALQSAMRLVLHHPEFQALESQWRSLDLLSRRVETDSNLQIVLYDVSAEELAADLSSQEDLSESGFYKLVTEVLDPEEGAGGFSALLGLYTFEETPPHAELLARIGHVAHHVDAPFFSAITPNYMDVSKKDRHPLVAQAWDKLCEQPQATHLALSSPRFLLRLPYGKKSDPISSFDFEEFSVTEGLRGMLWANPVILVAILLAATYKKDGKKMDLGSIMSLGDLPFHYVTDRFGDQVALPCTERNLQSDAAQHTISRGYMPVLWMKGRNEIRLGSFQSIAGGEVAGPWQTAPAPPTSAPHSPKEPIELEIDVPLDPDGEAADDVSTDTEASLDDLLAGFSDDPSETSDEDSEMDPDLAALLEGL